MRKDTGTAWSRSDLLIAPKSLPSRSLLFHMRWTPWISPGWAIPTPIPALPGAGGETQGPTPQESHKNWSFPISSSCYKLKQRSPSSLQSSLAGSAPGFPLGSVPAAAPGSPVASSRLSWDTCSFWCTHSPLHLKKICMAGTALQRSTMGLLLMM